MKEKMEVKIQKNKQVIGFSFFKLLLTKKTNKQIVLESHLSKDLNIAKK